MNGIDILHLAVILAAAACLAVQVSPPAMSLVSTLSRVVPPRDWIMCSRVQPVLTPCCPSTVFTRHTMPRPGSSMSCNQSFMESAGASGLKVGMALLSLSVRVSPMLSGYSSARVVRLCCSKSRSI